MNRFGWKAQYGKSSGDHGTLAFFGSCLQGLTKTKGLKKDMNACIDFVNTIVKGHFSHVLVIFSVPPAMMSHWASALELKRHPMQRS